MPHRPSTTTPTTTQARLLALMQAGYTAAQIRAILASEKKEREGEGKRETGA